MSNSDLTLHGRLVEAPELRFTPQGKAVANVTIAVNERIKDGDQWKDGEASFIRATAWGQMAEAMTEAGLEKGELVLATGILKVRKWEKDGKTGTSTEITLDDIGRSLKWVNKKEKKESKSAAYEDQPPF